MTSHDTPYPGDRTTLLRPQATGHLLRESIAEQRRPVDLVLDRVNEEDGENWVESFVDRWIGNELETDGHTLVVSGLSRTELARARERVAAVSKRDGDAPSPASVLAYFVLNAAALVHTGALLSSRNTGAFCEVFCDLAGMPDKRLRDLFEQAAELSMPK